jgi:hypothetical protein
MMGMINRIWGNSQGEVEDVGRKREGEKRESWVLTP